MMTQIPFDLSAFARAHGYEQVTCPDCDGTPSDTPCPNCGGTGRLWTSPRGSLSDTGLARLREILETGR